MGWAVVGVGVVPATLFDRSAQRATFDAEQRFLPSIARMVSFEVYAQFRLVNRQMRPGPVLRPRLVGGAVVACTCARSRALPHTSVSEFWPAGRMQGGIIAACYRCLTVQYQSGDQYQSSAKEWLHNNVSLVRRCERSNGNAQPRPHLFCPAASLPAAKGGAVWRRLKHLLCRSVRLLRTLRLLPPLLGGTQECARDC